MNEKNTVADVTGTGNPSTNNAAKRASRRKFLGQVGAALTGGMVLGKASLASAQSAASDDADGVQLPDSGDRSPGEKILRHPRQDRDQRSPYPRSAPHDQRR